LRGGIPPASEANEGRLTGPFGIPILLGANLFVDFPTCPSGLPGWVWLIFVSKSCVGPWPPGATGLSLLTAAQVFEPSDKRTEAAMLDPKLLEILACPRCKKPVSPLPDHSALDCLECGLRYRVEDDIPIMLLDEAEPIPPKG
jgi:uncharacterized protein YbaR (Trm112 family)